MHKKELLLGLKSEVRELIDRHLGRRGEPWFPHGLLFPSSNRQSDEERRETLRREAADIAPELRAVFVLNGLTESGLPHFHRLLAVYLGDDSFWNEWIDLWTAEEDRHDGVLHDYARLACFFDIGEVEKMQFEYMRAGFRPEWKYDPYQLIAYTAVQEQATQVSHGNLGKRLKSVAPECARLLGHIAGEEGRHAYFYRRVLGLLFSLDPDEAAVSFLVMAANFAMPGVAMGEYKKLAYVAMRTGVFTNEHFRKILSEVLAEVKLETISMATEAGKKAQEALFVLLKKLERVTGLFDRRPLQSLCFPFLPGQTVRI